MTRVLFAALALIAAVPKPHAAPKAASAQPTATAPFGEWNLKTDKLTANLATGAFTAPDHVTMTRADGSIVQADRATGNYKKRQAVLTGNVSVNDTSGTFGLKSAQGANSNQPRGPATLTSDTLRLDDAAHLYDANGNVHYEQGETKVDAQTAHLNDVTHELDLSGKVHVLRSDQTLDADRATYNTQSGDGAAESNVMVTFPGAPISIATPKPITIKKPKIP